MRVGTFRKMTNQSQCLLKISVSLLTVLLRVKRNLGRHYLG